MRYLAKALLGIAVGWAIGTAAFGVVKGLVDSGYRQGVTAALTSPPAEMPQFHDHPQDRPRVYGPI